MCRLSALRILLFFFPSLLPYLFSSMFIPFLSFSPFPSFFPVSFISLTLSPSGNHNPNSHIRAPNNTPRSLCIIQMYHLCSPQMYPPPRCKTFHPPIKPLEDKFVVQDPPKVSFFIYLVYTKVTNTERNNRLSFPLDISDD